MHAILGTILMNNQPRKESDPNKNPNGNNASKAILFEAINLLIRIAPQSALAVDAATLLISFMNSSDTNIQYLGIDTLNHLAKITNDANVFTSAQEAIIQTLSHKDISVRRRTVDLLFNMCTLHNSKWIVGELLKYLPLAEYSLKEDVVLKTAILAEKFATEHSWYVDVILKLIAIAGDSVNQEIFYRVIQIILSFPELQEYSALVCMKAITNPNFNENMVLVCGYILGEFGYLISSNPGCTSLDQFRALQSKFGLCKESTRALLLTCYVKFASKYPEIREYIITVFDQYRYVLDTDLQQRAMEYHHLLTEYPDGKLLKTMCATMPAFPEKESVVFKLLERKTQAPVENLPPAMKSRSSSASSLNKSRRGSPKKRPDSAAADKSHLQVPKSKLKSAVSSASIIAPNDPLKKNYLQAAGVLFDGKSRQVGFKSEFKDGTLQLGIYFGNKSSRGFHAITMSVEDEEQGFKFEVVQKIATGLSVGVQACQMYSVECLKPITSTPYLLISYVFEGDGKEYSVQVTLPILMTRFMRGIEMDAAQFFGRWKQIGDNRQYDFSLTSNLKLTKEEFEETLRGLNLQVLQGIDPNPENIVACCIFSCVELGKTGCLMRVEADYTNSVSLYHI